MWDMWWPGSVINNLNKITHMTPMTITVRRKTFKTFDQQHARITNFTFTRCNQLKAFNEIGFILFRVRKPRTVINIVSINTREKKYIADWKITCLIWLCICNNPVWIDKLLACEMKTCCSPKQMMCKMCGKMLKIYKRKMIDLIGLFFTSCHLMCKFIDLLNL